MALGARRSDVLKLVVGDGLLLCSAARAVGVPLGLISDRELSSFLYGTKPSDPMAFDAVSLLLTVVAALASYIPARRATRVDPMVALRSE